MFVKYVVLNKNVSNDCEKMFKNKFQSCHKLFKHFWLKMSLMFVTKYWKFGMIFLKNAKNSQIVSNDCEKIHIYNCTIVTTFADKNFLTIFARSRKMMFSASYIVGWPRAMRGSSDPHGTTTGQNLTSSDRIEMTEGVMENPGRGDHYDPDLTPWLPLVREHYGKTYSAASAL